MDGCRSQQQHLKYSTMDSSYRCSAADKNNTNLTVINTLLNRRFFRKSIKSNETSGVGVEINNNNDAGCPLSTCHTVDRITEMERIKVEHLLALQNSVIRYQLQRSNEIDIEMRRLIHRNRSKSVTKLDHQREEEAAEEIQVLIHVYERILDSQLKLKSTYERIGRLEDQIERLQLKFDCPAVRAEEFEIVFEDDMPTAAKATTRVTLV